MKKLLVIRSVSFQQLDLQSENLGKRFVGYESHLLTHPHGADIAGTLNGFDEVITYQKSGNFSFWHYDRKSIAKNYDAVVIPICNKAVFGYLNVIFFSLRIATSARYICDGHGNINKLSPWDILKMLGLSAIAKPVALLLSTLSILPIIITTTTLLAVKEIRKRNPSLEQPTKGNNTNSSV